MEKKITFIFLSSFSSIGGIQKFNNNFLNALNSIGNNKSYIINAFALNDKKEHLPFYQNINLWTSEGNKFLFLTKVISNIINTDILFVGHINLSFPLINIIKLISLKTKLVLITHGIEAWKIQSFIKRKVISYYNLILTVSNFTKEKIVNSNSILNSSIKIFPNTISEEFTLKPGKKPFSLLQKHALNSGNKILLTVCRISETEIEKGYDKVLNILPEIIKEFPEVIYVLAGKVDNKERKRIQNIINDLRLNNNVILPGQISNNDLLEYYQLCDLFVMPSKKEGFGIVFLEAILSGGPVIGGNVDGTVDALLYGEIGMLVNPDNSKELTLSVLNFFHNRWPSHLNDRWKLRNRVIQEFGFSKFVERLKIIIDTI